MGRKPKNDFSGEPIPSIQRALSILEFFCSAKRGRTITQVARMFAIPVSTCSSVLYTLVSCGYLTRDDSGIFSLTTKLLGYANMAFGQMELSEIAQSELETVVATTGLASALFIRDGKSVVCISKVEGTSHVRTAAHVGKRLPMHATCTGKAILAYLSEDELNALLTPEDLNRITENTITSAPFLRKELSRVRSLGYALDDQEYGIGVRGVSAPIFDSKGRITAAISASGAVFELNHNIAAVASAVKAAALQVSKALGYSESVVDSSYRQFAIDVNTSATYNRELQEEIASVTSKRS